jgi:SAM-dependent methyltransferase
MSLILALADTRDPNSLASRLRRRRFELFKTLLARVPRPVNILDVGGTEAFWRDSDIVRDPSISVTLLNLAFAREASPQFRQVEGDARSLGFPDKSFDVVYSNSVIEHVGGAADQLRMATEVQRVGQRYFVQTPNYYFPIEPHFLVPGFQFLPVSARARLLNSFDLGWTKRELDLESARVVVDSVKLLRRSDLARFFPNSKIYDERYLGLTKSFIAYGGF